MAIAENANFIRQTTRSIHQGQTLSFKAKRMESYTCAVHTLHITRTRLVGDGVRVSQTYTSKARPESQPHHPHARRNGTQGRAAHPLPWQSSLALENQYHRRKTPNERGSSKAWQQPAPGPRRRARTHLWGGVAGVRCFFVSPKPLRSHVPVHVACTQAQHHRELPTNSVPLQPKLQFDLLVNSNIGEF